MPPSVGHDLLISLPRDRIAPDLGMLVDSGLPRKWRYSHQNRLPGQEGEIDFKGVAKLSNLAECQILLGIWQSWESADY
jgi:hypothetical protein